MFAQSINILSIDFDSNEMYISFYQLSVYHQNETNGAN